MIAEGKHIARATSGLLGITKTGKEHVRVQFQVEGPDGGFVSWDGYFTEKTEERTLDSLKHAGWDEVSISELNGLGSTEVQIDVEHEANDQGKVFGKVKWVNRIGASVQKELSTSQASSLQSRLEARLMRRRGKSGAPATQSTGEWDGSGPDPDGGEPY